MHSFTVGLSFWYDYICIYMPILAFAWAARHSWDAAPHGKKNNNNKKKNNKKYIYIYWIGYFWNWIYI